MLKAFRRAVYEIPTQEDELGGVSTSLCLQRLFYKLQVKENESVSAKVLMDSPGWPNFQVNADQDPSEFQLNLEESLENQVEGTQAEGALSSLFEGETE